MTMTQELIQNALDKDYNKANNIFGEIMTQKVNDLLDQEQIKLADHIYNDAEPDDEFDDDQLELDLEDEDEDNRETETGAEVGEEGVSEPNSDAEVEMGDEDDLDKEE